MKDLFMTLTLSIASVTLFVSCCKGDGGKAVTPVSDKSIVILYDNDVHCAIDGYTKIADLRNAINQTDTAECIIVSSGDYLSRIDENPKDEYFR